MSDREVIENILENPYLQYFLGYKEFLFEIPFDHSMLTHFRKRFNFENFTDTMNEMITKYEELF